jgi:hypothetical protein
MENVNAFRAALRGEKSDWATPQWPGENQTALPSTDAKEEGLGDTGDVIEDIIGSTFGLHYRDVTGEESHRRVTFLKVSMSGRNFMIGAHCHERKAWRAFRADRVIELIDLRSGEIITRADEWCAGLIRRDGPEAMLEACSADVRILAGMARCDGHFHEAESEVLVAHVLDTIGGVGVDVPAMMRAADGVYPSPEQIQKAVRQVKRYDKEAKRLLMKSAQRLIEADGILRDVEFDMASEIKDAIKA